MLMLDFWILILLLTMSYDKDVILDIHTILTLKKGLSQPNSTSFRMIAFEDTRPVVEIGYNTNAYKIVDRKTYTAIPPAVLASEAVNKAFMLNGYLADKSKPHVTVTGELQYFLIDVQPISYKSTANVDIVINLHFTDTKTGHTFFSEKFTGTHYSKKLFWVSKREQANIVSLALANLTDSVAASASLKNALSERI